MELEVGQPGVCQNLRSPVLGSGGTAVEVGQRLIHLCQPLIHPMLTLKGVVFPRSGRKVFC